MKKIKCNKPSNFIVLLFVSIVLFNCESFIEVDLPDSKLTSNIVFSDVGTAEAAMANIYSKLQNDVLVCGNSLGISILLGSYADELDTYSNGSIELQFYQNSLISTNSFVTSLWKGSFNLVYAANAVKEGLENSTTISQIDKDRLLGEVLFLRAYIHFHLLNLFGDIPYITTTDYIINTTIGKLPQTQIYTLLIDDLKKSKSIIPAVNQSQFKTRPGINTVKSLLARIYSYKKEWELAEIEASSVINSNNFEWVESLDDVFLKTSTGTIWQMPPSKNGLPTQEGQSYIFTMGPPPNRALSPSLMHAFEPGDLRQEHWIGRVEGKEDTWYYPFKYKQSTAETTSNEYSILFRLEELYLIRAEARMHLGDSDGAKKDLNKIRNRASLADTSAETEQQFIEAIIQERRIEFFSELGHRFFDLKRMGLLNNKLSPIKPGWDTTDILFPIPQSELLLNPNLLPQNEGY
ncbi:RagB/SusD family nutrient uptake outer membrane protein [Gelidibacter sp. F63206]|uniref:RagB/SusD family nutrient uptake outer membrane protein n=1 Tax=Gelidibacter sp. F63206 TaxID=2926425 RepID=UPI001FF26F05|nr:RagB/SusD family nutrient uptake outer membrane protein [Gelidibacter sp. F63206]MCK0115240.1 RagB/SusD family nutrient uptake outer membrane protein [Gelidibacter sp. F63206]